MSLSNLYVPRVLPTLSGTIEEEIRTKKIIEGEAFVGQPTRRDKHEFRSIHCEPGVVFGASGSGYFEIGDTKVLCSVHGPRAVQRNIVESGQLDCEVRYAPFAKRPDSNSEASGGSGGGGAGISSSERQISQMMREALMGSIRLDQYPKMVISIYVIILQSSGSIGGDLSSSINCGSLALADASIELLDFVTACTVALSNNNAIEISSSSSSSSSAPSYLSILDPSNIESRLSIGKITIAGVSTALEISQVWCEGRIDPLVISEMTDIACSGNKQIRSVLAECMRGKIMK